MRRFNQSKKPLLPESVKIEIDRVSHDGRGIGHHKGRVVMATNALPGERCKVRIDKGNTNLWQGRAVEVVQPAQERVAPVCKHYGHCGGCQQQHISQPFQIALKEGALRDQFKHLNLQDEVWQPAIVSEPFKYRHRARFHVSKTQGIGFKAARDHKVIEIEQCPVLREPVQTAVQSMTGEAPLKGIEQFEIAVDDEGHIGFTVIKGRHECVRALSNWAQEQNWIVDQSLSYRVAEQRSEAKPGEFTQVNRAINERMADQAIDWLQPHSEDRLLDLFCGNGNLTFPFTGKVERGLGIEASEAAILNAQSCSQPKSKMNFLVKDLFKTPLESMPEVLELKPTIALLDPPRAGAQTVCSGLQHIESLNKLVYVSCDPATMARDLQVLKQDKWHLRKVGLIDMFPQTRHIETMVLLQK